VHCACWDVFSRRHKQSNSLPIPLQGANMMVTWNMLDPSWVLSACDSDFKVTVLLISNCNCVLHSASYFSVVLYVVWSTDLSIGYFGRNTLNQLLLKLFTTTGG
jgi:hypothetical protein